MQVTKNTILRVVFFDVLELTHPFIQFLNEERS